MALEAEPSLRAADLAGARPGREWVFWNLRTALALELGLFAVVLLLSGAGDALVAAGAGLFVCALVSFLAALRSDSPLGIAARRLVKKKIAMAALTFIALFYLGGTLAPVLPIRSYTQQDLTQAERDPSWWPVVKPWFSGRVGTVPDLFTSSAWSHPFGTDRLGRDQFSRVIWASQTTVIVTLATLFTGGIVLAVGLGLTSGYLGGWVDTLIMRIGDIFAGLPGILMLILINATLKNQVRALASDVERLTGVDGIVKSGAPDYFLVFGALSLFGWVGGARVIRSQILALRETEFILAARSVGASTGRILARHLLPNVSNIIIVSLSLGLAGIAGSEIILTWFGIGIQPPRPSFGSLIFDASSVRTVNVHPYLLFFPGAVVAGLLFSFNLLGDALTDVFTPKAK